MPRPWWQPHHLDAQLRHFRRAVGQESAHQDRQRSENRPTRANTAGRWDGNEHRSATSTVPVYRQALSPRSSAKPQPRTRQNRIRRITGWRERYCPPVNYSAINCPFSVQLADFAVLLALYGLTAESQCSWQVQLIEPGKGQSRSSGRRRIAVVENLYVPRVVAKFRRAVPPVPGELLTRFKRRPGIPAACPDAMVLRTFGLIN